ncbi:hypothetical protein [Flavobacterium aestivum]|uniref:hypothetical protein n=1 Tax=Flavobacterium aestivum TaxID=3003257 RepID=UPI002285879C|nr:hypothetical protein [Flavobacterium aestivum]
MIDKITLKQEADKLFASTSHEVLFASPAGEFFTSEKIGSLSIKAGEKLIKFEKTETKELNANDTIAKIKAVTSLQELAAFAGDDRKSVISVYGWKEKQLIEAIKVVGAKTEGTNPPVAGNGNADTDTQK